MDLYGQLLPQTSPDWKNWTVAIEKSPSYFETETFPGIVDQIQGALPHSKIVITLCNPTERLFSEYNHKQNKGKTDFERFYHDAKVPIPKNFSDFVSYFEDNSVLCRNLKLAGYCDAHRRMYLRTGQFHKHLAAWNHAMGEANVLVLNMNADPEITARKLLQHAGLPLNEFPWEQLQRPIKSNVNHDYAGRSSGYGQHGEALRWLAAHYSPHNKILAAAIGEEWPLEWNLPL